MKIVVLDGYTLNPGDLSWGELERLASCRVYDRTPPELLIERAVDAQIVLTNKVVLSEEVISALPNLRYVGVLATGYNVVDLAAARSRGIVVTNVPAYSTSSVVQMVFALLLEMTQQVGHHARLVSEGAWSRCPDFSFCDRPLIELDGKTIGIVGYGRIGRGVANVASAFGMDVQVCTAHPDHHAAVHPSVRFVDLETLFETSDVVTLHCPLTEETKGMVNVDRLARMKRGAFLVNTGRGLLVDEDALAAALESGHLAGAGLDVLSSEPPFPQNPLIGAKNVFITPHIAWATLASRRRLLDVTTGNVNAFIAGVPLNVVS